MFQQCGRNPRLKNAQVLIIAGGFNCNSIKLGPSDCDSASASRILLGVEYDEDEIETSEPISEEPACEEPACEEPAWALGCEQCEGRMRTSRDEWMSS